MKKLAPIVALLLAHCGDAGDDRGLTGGDSEAVHDGGLADAGPFTPPARDMSLETDDGFAGLDPSLGVGGEDGVAPLDRVRSCYDDSDNDGDALFDCRDDGCFGLDACCQGSARAACCSAPVTVAQATFEDCADVDACLPAARVFGTPAPVVVGGALGLGGDALYDSGVLWDTTVDLATQSLKARATFVDTTSCAGCFDGAAIGVTTQTEFGERAHVAARVAVVHRAGGALRLLLDGTRWAELPAVSGEPVTLELRADGHGALEHGGTTVTFEHGVRDPVRLVAWGHATNPSATAPEGVFVADVSLEASHCPMPDTWRDTGALGWPADTVASATDGDLRWVVLGTPEGPRFLTDAGEGWVDGDLSVGSIGWTAAPIGWGLTHDGSDLWLTFEGETGELGGRALGRARLVGSTFYPEPLPFFAPSVTATDASWMVAEGHELIVATVGERVALWGRGPSIPASALGDGWTPFDTDLGDVLGPVAEPHLVASPEGAWLLHAVRRVGTRHRLVAAASDELLAWRSLGEVFREGAVDDFDAFGATSPDVHWRDDALELLFVGRGVTERTLGRAVRPLGARR